MKLIYTQVYEFAFTADLVLQHQAAFGDGWAFGGGLFCPLLPCLLHPSDASYTGLSLAPGQGHCFITAQLQAGDSR